MSGIWIATAHWNILLSLGKNDRTSSMVLPVMALFWPGLWEDKKAHWGGWKRPYSAAMATMKRSKRTGTCPRCGTPGWGDVGQRREVAEALQVDDRAPRHGDVRADAPEVALHRLTAADGRPLLLAIPWANEPVSVALTIPGLGLVIAGARYR